MTTGKMREALEKQGSLEETEVEVFESVLAYAHSGDYEVTDPPAYFPSVRLADVNDDGAEDADDAEDDASETDDDSEFEVDDADQDFMDADDGDNYKPVYHESNSDEDSGDDGSSYDPVDNEMLTEYPLLPGNEIFYKENELSYRIYELLVKSTNSPKTPPQVPGPAPDPMSASVAEVEAEASPMPDSSADESNLLMHHARVYVFADKHQVPGLRELAAYKFRNLASYGFGAAFLMEIAVYLYQNTRSDGGDALRSYVACLVAFAVAAAKRDQAVGTPEAKAKWMRIMSESGDLTYAVMKLLLKTSSAWMPK